MNADICKHDYIIFIEYYLTELTNMMITGLTPKIYLSRLFDGLHNREVIGCSAFLSLFSHVFIILSLFEVDSSLHLHRWWSGHVYALPGPPCAKEP